MKTREELEAQKIQFLETKKMFAAMPTAGRRLEIPRPGKKSIEAIWYEPKAADHPLPVYIYNHGGAWVAGDPIMDDKNCASMAQRIPAVVINLNYKKLFEEPFPYPQQENVDTVKWLKDNAKELHVDPNRIALGGGSAGGHIAAGAAILLAAENIKISGQVLEFPFTDFTFQREGMSEEIIGLLNQMHDEFFPDLPMADKVVSPCQASDEALRNVAPAVIIIGTKDPLYTQGMNYAKRLEDAGVKVLMKAYPGAGHGFMLDGMVEGSKEALEQKAMAADCVEFKVHVLREMFQ